MGIFSFLFGKKSESTKIHADGGRTAAQYGNLEANLEAEELDLNVLEQINQIDQITQARNEINNLYEAFQLSFNLILSSIPPKITLKNDITAEKVQEKSLEIAKKESELRNIQEYENLNEHNLPNRVGEVFSKLNELVRLVREYIDFYEEIPGPTIDEHELYKQQDEFEKLDKPTLDDILFKDNDNKNTTEVVKLLTTKLGIINNIKPSSDFQKLLLTWKMRELQSEIDSLENQSHTKFASFTTEDSRKILSLLKDMKEKLDFNIAEINKSNSSSPTI